MSNFVGAGLRPARILLFLALLAFGQTLHAQDYLFSVPKVKMDVHVQKDGGVIIYYRMDFRNSSNGHAIDIVDVGLPHEDYDTSRMKGWANDQEVGPIQKSQYVNPGVEVHLGSQTIPAGGTGRFEFQTDLPNLVFQDTTRKDYASMQITPTWFGAQYVEGTTDLTIRVILPPGLKLDEVLYQDVPFTGKELGEDGSAIVSWDVNRSFTSEYRVGVSFPKRVMNRVVTMTTTQLLMRWWRGVVPWKARLWIAGAAAIALFIIYMRFTGSTGCVFFVPILIVFGFFFVKFEATEVLIWPVLVILAVITETARKKRKGKYLPAIASVEGGGVKRGLTAPEAGVLLEFPINKVITLVLFGMLKKGMIRQIAKDPVTVEVVEGFGADIVPHDYEKEFLKQLGSGKSAKPINKLNLSKAMQFLVDSVAKRMVGYDLAETREYYTHIIARAWNEAKEVGDVEAWQKKMDEKVDWMMLDPDFSGRFQPYQDRYIPRSYRTTGIGTSSSSPAPSTKTSSQQGTTRFSDVAASVSGWFQNTSESAIGSVEGQSGGILNFASVDKAINKAMASSGSGGRGGGGGGCACACAGCACACACAGGGR